MNVLTESSWECSLQSCCWSASWCPASGTAGSRYRQKGESGAWSATYPWATGRTLASYRSWRRRCSTTSTKMFSCPSSRWPTDMRVPSVSRDSMGSAWSPPTLKRRRLSIKRSSRILSRDKTIFGTLRTETRKSFLSTFLNTSVFLSSLDWLICQDCHLP